MVFVWDVYFSLHLIVEESRRQPFPSPPLSLAVVVESLQIVTRLCVERKMWLENGDVAGSSLKRCFLKQPMYSYLLLVYCILDSAILIWRMCCYQGMPTLHGDDDAYGFFVPGTWNIYGKVKVESLTFSINFFGVMKTLELRVASTWVIECTTCEH